MQKTFRKRIITQIGILTEDIQTAKTAWEKFLGLPSQQISQSDGYAQTHAVYRGEPLEAVFIRYVLILKTSSWN